VIAHVDHGANPFPSRATSENCGILFPVSLDPRAAPLTAVARRGLHQPVVLFHRPAAENPTVV